MICYIYRREKVIHSNRYLVDRLMEIDGRKHPEFLISEYITLMSRPDYFGKTEQMHLKVIKRTTMPDGDVMIIGEKFDATAQPFSA